MTWLSDMLRMSSPSSFMTYHRVCNRNNTTRTTCEVGAAYPVEAPSSSPVFSGVRVTRSLALCVCFVPFLSVIVLSVLLLINALVSPNLSY